MWRGRWALVGAVLAACAAMGCAAGRARYLAEAAERGDATAIAGLVKRGVPVDSRDRYGQTPLHVAARAVQLSSARELLRCGASVAARDRIGYTPLHCAAHQDSSAIVALLLVAGAPVNARDDDGVTPLWSAMVRAESPDVVALLLEHGADPNAVTTSGAGRTPAMRAASRGWTRVLALLAAHGARLDVHDRSGDTALHLAARAGQRASVELVLRLGADPSARDGDGKTPADLAEAKGHHDLATLLRDAEQGKLPEAPASESAAAGAESR